MAKTERQKTGDRGETVASTFLERHGFHVKARNYRKPWGEIDIVAEYKKTTHFIEVKTVVRDFAPSTPLSDDEHEAEENVHTWKKERFRRTIETYLAENRVPEQVPYQFDVIAVYLSPDGRRAKLRYLPDQLLS